MIFGKMEIESFKNYIGMVHEIELARVLGVPMNDFEHRGIDLLDDVKGVEVKSCLVNSKSANYKKRYAKWTLFGYQLTWDKKYDVPLYCAIGTYDVGELEEFVTKREFWVIPWDWTMKFPIKNGKHHNYRYLRKKPLASTGIPPIPETQHGEFIPKGFLHFTEGVDMKHFPGL